MSKRNTCSPKTVIFYGRRGFRPLIKFHKGQNNLTQSLKNRKQDLTVFVYAFCKVDTTCCDGICSDLVSFDFSSVLWGAIFYSLAFWSKCLWYSALQEVILEYLKAYRQQLSSHSGYHVPRQGVKQRLQGRWKGINNFWNKSTVMAASGHISLQLFISLRFKIFACQYLASLYFYWIRNFTFYRNCQSKFYNVCFVTQLTNSVVLFWYNCLYVRFIRLSVSLQL